MKVSIKNLIAVLFIASLSMTACSKKSATEENLLPSAANADENMMGDSDSGKASGLQTINFPYDSSVLDSQAKSILKANAQIMKDKPSLNIQIEGHCDSRGGIQYNLGLGERRAKAVKSHMASLGVKASRITTISYGKEKLVDMAETEEAHAKNRRANFVITSR